jgi:hypothetical protein
MKKLPDLKKLSLNQLVNHFADIALQQHSELDANDVAEVNKLFWQLEAIEAELKARGTDQRDALLALYKHPNAQVRLKAAKATLTVAPGAAREMLRSIAESTEYPQAGEAGMSLWNLERGVFQPT